MENRVLRAHAGARYGRQSRIVAAMHCVRVSKYMHRECHSSLWTTYCTTWQSLEHPTLAAILFATC